MSSNGFGRMVAGGFVSRQFHQFRSGTTASEEGVRTCGATGTTSSIIRTHSTQTTQSIKEKEAEERKKQEKIIEDYIAAEFCREFPLIKPLTTSEILSG